MSTSGSDFQRALDMFLAFDILEIDRIDHISFMRNWASQIGCQRTLARKMRRQISPDGYLFLGTAETTLSLHAGYERVPQEQSSCYQLRRDA